MRRGDQIRHQVAPRSNKRQRSYAQLVRERWSGRFFDELGRSSALSPRLRTLQSTAPASKNEGSAHRAARRVARTMLPRKTTKIECKNDPKSIEVGRLGYVEVPTPIEVGSSWSVEAPKSIEVGRSGSVEAPKSIEVRRSWPGRSRWHVEQARACVKACGPMATRAPKSPQKRRKRAKRSMQEKSSRGADTT